MCKQRIYIFRIYMYKFKIQHYILQMLRILFYHQNVLSNIKSKLS